MQTDLSALKFNQITVVVITAVSLLTRSPWLAGLLGLVMLLGAVQPRLSLLRALYRLSWRLGVKPQVIAEDPAAHHFAQGVGGVFLLLSGAAGLLGFPLLGAVLGLIVIALALLNLTARICVGCLLYFQWQMLRYRLTQAR